ncbi:MAG: hypothetical protein R2939_18640 [Kofleriaceae bacterium]
MRDLPRRPGHRASPPLAELPATVGARRITLVNKEHGIRKSVTATVTAGKATKVVKDYTALIK